MSERMRRSLDALFLLFGVAFTIYLIRYYVTGAGGATTLAVLLVPVAYVLFVLDALRKDELYPKLPLAANYVLASVYIALALAVSAYMSANFYDIRTVRAGFWNTTDLTMGAIMALLVMEYARLRYIPLFILNIILVVYAVFGTHVGGMFHHPGLSWERIASAMSVEITTGVFSQLPQIALTLIGSFILVLSVLRAFGCVDSILRGASRIAVRWPYALPQAAVIGSMGVAAVSGSGAANAATTGTATIPAMIGAGISPPRAAAIEASASLGGQLMPPVMGISAFLMAEFMGVSYFDVVARGYAPALVFFLSVVVSVYLLSVRHRVVDPVIDVEPMRGIDWVNIAAFLAVVSALIALMGLVKMAPMLAALRVFTVAAVLVLVLHVTVRMKDAQGWSWRPLLEPSRRFVSTFSSMVSDLTLLLATLSIMTGALVITGVPTKLGALLMDAAGVNLAVMALVAFLFSALLGTGLPPAPTYIITALVIVPPMIRAGIDPWVVHFFAFFCAVWGELTPPTSVVAAVTARIAETSFMRTLGHALVMCVSLFTLMIGVFTHPQLVLEPGLAQLAAFGMILTATIGVCFSMHARFFDTRFADISMRLALVATSLAVLLIPDPELSATLCVPVLLVMAYWVLMRRSHWVKPYQRANA
jgi:TRAP transporter 4TM/12TM fusion protein